MSRPKMNFVSVSSIATIDEIIEQGRDVDGRGYERHFEILKAMDEREKGHYYKLEEVFGTAAL